MDLTTLRVDVHAGVASITIDHPPINLLDSALRADLDRVTRRLEDDRSIRVAVFQSALPDFFIAHADVRPVPRPRGAADSQVPHSQLDSCARRTPSSDSDRDDRQDRRARQGRRQRVRTQPRHAVCRDRSERLRPPGGGTRDHPRRQSHAAAHALDRSRTRASRRSSGARISTPRPPSATAGSTAPSRPTSFTASSTASPGGSRPSLTRRSPTPRSRSTPPRPTRLPDSSKKHTASPRSSTPKRRSTP